MEKSKINSFAKRLISAVVLIPVVVGYVMYGYTSMYLLAMLGAALLSWEWATMVPNKRSPFYAVTYFFIAVTAILLGSFEGWIGSMVAALALVFLRTGDENTAGFCFWVFPIFQSAFGRWLRFIHCTARRWFCGFCFWYGVSISAVMSSAARLKDLSWRRKFLRTKPGPDCLAV